MANILLVDDDALLRDTVRQMLEIDGHEVREADNGQAGLSACERHRDLDLVITDMLMPVLDGAQFIVELRRRKTAVPVIAISGGRRALSPEFNLQTAGIVGATLQLPKPFDRASLRDAVNKALATKGN
jgi:CheY-like chemotaxis protein